MNGQKRKSLIASAGSFIVLMLLIFSPGFFVVNGKDLWYTENEYYMTDLSFLETLEYFREREGEYADSYLTVLKIMGGLLLISVVLIVLFHLFSALGSTSFYVRGLAVISSVTATIVCVLYAPLASILVDRGSETRTFSNGETGWIVLLLLVIISVVSIINMREKVPEGTDKKTESVVENDVQ